MTFNPTKYWTKCCNDIIWSRFPGEFRKCSCGQVAIDQTEHYRRLLGDPRYYELYEEKDEEDNEG